MLVRSVGCSQRLGTWKSTTGGAGINVLVRISRIGINVRRDAGKLVFCIS